ncbi:hypothetical protein ABIE08_002944 [Kaistia defluvii]|uniref:Uncharacterized protein n=1 Tax=Kaistia defluvii TaxID=410841 RepID=A0ABV2R160_9HYPH
MRNLALHKLWSSEQLDLLAALKPRARKHGLTIDVRDLGTNSCRLLVICFYRADAPVLSFTDLAGAALWVDQGAAA